ncbi:hypothetical protein GGX14DRAFT_636950 [Mycena pura]|uniref:Fumarylacetoacetase-like C-terminal domain-containing protein n=1 Tax=Mycena pura TaxID=153505 RepID=A0AAD6Y882_9AGAR|nr:hypothetical protein GGX14DRAFT_636950 [Mycena pura]
MLLRNRRPSVPIPGHVGTASVASSTTPIAKSSDSHAFGGALAFNFFQFVGNPSAENRAGFGGEAKSKGEFVSLISKGAAFLGGCKELVLAEAHLPYNSGMTLDELEVDTATQQAVEALVTLSHDSMDIISWALSDLLERLAKVRGFLAGGILAHLAPRLKPAYPFLREHHAQHLFQPVLTSMPILFAKPVTGPGATVVIPKAVQPPKEHLPDYEVELVIVIGKAANDVSEADALDYVLGYTGANDVSFRKLQMATSQWGFSKGFDNTNPIGPCLVSAAAIPDPQKVSLKCTVNSAVVQDGSTAEQIFSIRKTVAFLSQGTTLEPGSVILTGTPKGVGFVKKPPLCLKDGDRVSV